MPHACAVVFLIAAAAAAASPAPPAGAPAPERTITLRDVIARAVTGNPDLLRARVAIETADANLLSARGAFDVVLTSNATLARATTPPITNSTADRAAGFTRALTLDLGLARALETGGQVSLLAREIATTTNSQFQCGTECTFHGANLTLAFRQPLLRGFGPEVALANVRHQQIVRDAALLDRQARAAVVLREVVNTYWELAFIADDLAIRRSAVALAEEQRKATQALVDVGRLGALELAAVERAIAERQQEVALGEQAALERALDLEHLLGSAVSPGFTAYAAADRPAPGDASIDTTAETARALESSPQLKAIRAGVALSELDLRTAELLLAPVLDFVGSVGAGGRQTDLPSAWSQAGRLEALSWSAGLAFQWPVQNRVARGTRDAARAGRARAQIEAGDLELAIRDGVVRLAGTVRTAVRRHDLARAAVGYAEKNLEAERARFEVGRSTNNDVLLRQQELKNTEAQVARAAADQAIAEAALAALTGEILERYGVVLR